MKDNEIENRGTLIRNSLIFQLKLIADGFRDVALVPVSLFATLAGLIRGGDETHREFHKVIEIGRQTEQWINLFGQHDPIEKAGPAGSIDMLLTRAEDVVREQVRAGGISETASRALNRALSAAHHKAKEGTVKKEHAQGERSKDI